MWVSSVQFCDTSSVCSAPRVVPLYHHILDPFNLFYLLAPPYFLSDNHYSVDCVYEILFVLLIPVLYNPHMDEIMYSNIFGMFLE